LKSLICREFEPLTGTQNRDTALMTYRMAYITTRADSSHHLFRLRTPADVLARGGMNRRVLIQFPEFMYSRPFITTVTIGAEIKFSLRTREDDVAEFRRSVALAELNKVFAAIRAGPQPLTHKQLLGLSRAIHELYVEAFQDDPGSKDIWIAHKALNRAVAEGRIRDVEPIIPGQMPDDQETAAALFGEYLTVGINALPRSADGADRARRSGPYQLRRRSHRDERSIQDRHAPDRRRLRSA
jgi:hypothetical protein